MNSTVGIQVKKLEREFRNSVKAVDGIDLEVAPGEIYGFLGPNGAGKSTTVLMLSTLLPPTGGQALVGGFDVVTQGEQVRRIIGAALQEVALDPFLTAIDHMKLQGALHGLAKADINKRSEELLGRVGLTQAAGRTVGQYSGGMRRRLDLALALIHRPKILFLDEPTTGLDIQSRTALWDEVKDLSMDGTTIFLTTQYLEEADVLADRVGIINAGKIVAEGTPAALKAEVGQAAIDVTPRNPRNAPKAQKVLERFGDVVTAEGRVRVRLAKGRGSVAEVVRELDKAKIVVEDLSVHSPTLDDVFLEKTGRSLEGASE